MKEGKRAMQKKSSLILICSFFLIGLAVTVQADILVVGSASNLELMSNLVVAFGANTGILVDLRGPGSLEGLHRLSKGKTDVAFISRMLSDKEKASGLEGIPYCRDAVAVVVHPASRLENLTRHELKEIFTGNRTKWDDGTGVVVLMRDSFSGTRQLFQEKIMGDESFAPATVRIEKKGEGVIFSPIFSTHQPQFFPLIQKEEDMLFSLAKIRGAIAYLSVGRIPKESRVIKIDGVALTGENINNGSYLLSRTPMLVTLGKPKNESKQLIDFILSPVGQKIVERMGYIPINE